MLASRPTVNTGSSAAAPAAASGSSSVPEAEAGANSLAARTSRASCALTLITNRPLLLQHHGAGMLSELVGLRRAAEMLRSAHTNGDAVTAPASSSTAAVNVATSSAAGSAGRDRARTPGSGGRRPPSAAGDSSHGVLNASSPDVEVVVPQIPGKSITNGFHHVLFIVTLPFRASSPCCSAIGADRQDYAPCAGCGEGCVCGCVMIEGTW